MVPVRVDIHYDSFYLNKKAHLEVLYIRDGWTQSSAQNLLAKPEFPGIGAKCKICLILPQNKGWIASFVPSSSMFYDSVESVTKYHGAEESFTLQIKKGRQIKWRQETVSAEKHQIQAKAVSGLLSFISRWEIFLLYNSKLFSVSRIPYRFADL